MSDFFDKDELNKKIEQSMDQQPVSTEAEKVKVGDKEFTQDELSRLVGLGSTAAELESKWNTKIDSLMPSYTKATQQLKDYEEQLEAFKKEKEEKKSATPDEMAEARKLLKEQFGVLTRDDFETEFRSRYEVEKAAEKLNGQLDKLAKDIDGVDGRPPFKPEDVLRYMADNNLKDPNLAYKIKFEKELDGWKEKQIQSVKKPGLITEKTAGAGVKTPEAVVPTRTNLVELLKEAL